MTSQSFQKLPWHSGGSPELPMQPVGIAFVWPLGSYFGCSQTPVLLLQAYSRVVFIHSLEFRYRYVIYVDQLNVNSTPCCFQAQTFIASTYFATLCFFPQGLASLQTQAAAPDWLRSDWGVCRAEAGAWWINSVGEKDTYIIISH